LSAQREACGSPFAHPLLEPRYMNVLESVGFVKARFSIRLRQARAVSEDKDGCAGLTSFFNVLPKTQTVAVAVFYVEVAAAVGLIANVACDLYAL